ncbi:Brp/Blh family beta-carotene 15,15'-dioxygenase [Novosphingobium sp. FKTRR1]|uniref:Brp/Blh family beta-carotene 15,15'-dioxygenase n=1 Tax=Novosphingobium sp. FKTRR1 TaxID=2879118 RepID=UPI001CF05883|nr:Brp/Blh family beta-carotene 15,15'-dioxygenase [Novosphingobium sp. FKTRR1]
MESRTLSSGENGQTRISPVFWLLLVLASCNALGARFGLWSVESEPMALAAIGIMLLGGLPHGACDLSLAAKAWGSGRRELFWVLVPYLLVAVVMALLWWRVPLLALVVFMCLSAFHFGEDWGMLPGGLLRAMAGLAVISVASFGQQVAVTELFIALTRTPDAALVAQWLAASAPVAVLVTAVGLYQSWRSGHRIWVAAYALGYLGLLILPPLEGFTLFFVGLHAPRHWRQLIATLPTVLRQRALREGAGLSALSIALLAIWLVLQKTATSPSAADLAPYSLHLGAEVFRMLSILAAPHLALSIAIEQRLTLAALDPTHRPALR